MMTVVTQIALKPGCELDALEEARLVERRPDPDDRRATLVAPTSRGEEVAAGIRAARAAEAE